MIECFSIDPNGLCFSSMMGFNLFSNMFSNSFEIIGSEEIGF